MLPAARSAAIFEDIVEFIQNPAGFWSNAGEGFGILAIGSGARLGLATATAANVLGLAMISPSFVAPVVIPEEEGEAAPERSDFTGKVGAVAAPILALSGSDDPAIPATRIDQARAAAPHAEWIVYEGVGAGFEDDYGEGFDQPAFADAMERIAVFFEKTLPPA